MEEIDILLSPEMREAFTIVADTIDSSAGCRL